MGSNLLRVQVARWRRWLLPLAISMTSLLGAQVSAQCWGGTCNPPSAHSVDWCQISNGMGGGSGFSRGSGVIDVASVLRQGCTEYAVAESRPGATVVWNSCSPVLPSPALASYGGQWGSYNVTGSLYVVDSAGAVLYAASGEWGLATCGCVDSLNNNLVALGNNGQCYCTHGHFWNDQIRACVPAPPPVLRIDLYGKSRTRALPAGPALPQTAHVSQNGIPAAGKAVSIAIAPGASLSGTTDGQGNFRFRYEPPRTTATAVITASCVGCVNTATNTIQVEGPEPAMCPADPGMLVGNPINTATGEKLQSEADWQDMAAHPLSLVRTYASFASFNAGFGPRWSHNHDASLSKTDLAAIVRFGDGSKVLFERDSATSAWTSDNQRDRLTESPTGLQYTRASDETTWLFLSATGRLQSVTQRNGWTMSMAYNGAGQLVSVSNAFGRSLQFAYDGAGRVVSAATPDAQRLSYGYDALGRLASVLLPDGTSRTYQYESAVQPYALTGITNEARVRYATFTYDSSGRAVSTEHAGGASAYNVGYPNGAQASVGSIVAGITVDPSIYRATAQVTDPLGTAQTYTWQGGDGRVRLLNASGAFEGGRVANRSFGSLYLPDSETDFLGVQTMFTWDLSRQLKLSTTKAAGRPEARTDSTQWHPGFRLPVLITEAGRTTAYAYDAMGNKLGETVTDLASGQARTTQWTYTANGLVATMTDPKGATWTYAYDSAGNRVSERNPLGQQSSYGYDTAGRVVSQTEPNGLVTAYTYDARGRLVRQVRGDETTTYTYTPTGQLAGATMPNGFQVSYSYDAAQRLVGAIDNRGATIQYTLDPAGNRLREEVKDSSGAIALATSRVIGDLNKVAAIKGAVGQTTALTYDANGELVAQSDPLNQTTRQTLDALRRPVATTFADNASATQAWNQLDQLTRATDPKGVATNYQTNAFGELMGESSPDIGTMTYQRNAAGEVTGITDAVGNATAISLDALGRPTTIQYAPDQLAAFSYDQGQAGYLGKIDDKSGTTTYVRDAQGRILSKTQAVNDNPANPSQFKVQYGYTGGELTSVSYPSGLKVFYRRTAGRVTGIDVQEPFANPLKPKPLVPFVTGLAHTALGQPKAWTWAGGDSAARSFDTDGRMTASEFASYSYDAASRITAITQNLWASRTSTSNVTQLYTTPLSWTAGYDSRNRLTSFARAGASTSYSYDANSNRLTAVDKVTSDTDLDGLLDGDDFSQSTSQGLAIDAASNRLLGFTQSVTKVKGTKTQSITSSQINYALDANGAMTSDGLRGFEYDASRRLSKVKIFKDGEAAKVSYLHNALGQRVFKSEVTSEQTLPNQATLGLSFIDWLKKNFQWMFVATQSSTSVGTAFVYDEGGNLLGEYDNGSAAGKGRQEYIWLPADDGSSIPIGIYRGGRFFAVHADHLGTPRLITDDANKPVWQWPYSAFGNNKPIGVLKAPPNPKAAVTNQPVALKATSAGIEANLRFPGQYFDEESNLSYNYFRSYNAAQGRYTQPDPIGLAGGINRFAYVGGSPLSYSDPLGLWATDAHDYFLDKMFPELPGPIRDIIKEGSAYADTPKFQADEYAFMHAMSSNAMTPVQSQELMCKYIKGHLDQVARDKANGNPRYWFGLGMALHAVMDSTSPAHEGFQKWHGATKDGRRHGPWPSSVENLKAAMDPNNTRRTLERMRDAMNGNLGSCGCQ